MSSECLFRVKKSNTGIVFHSNIIIIRQVSLRLSASDSLINTIDGVIATNA